MEPCYEYLGCNKTDCIMLKQKKTTKCWEKEDTSCNHPGIDMVRSSQTGKKVEACKRSGCIYYQAAQKRGLV